MCTTLKAILCGLSDILIDMLCTAGCWSVEILTSKLAAGVTSKGLGLRIVVDAMMLRWAVSATRAPAAMEARRTHGL